MPRFTITSTGATRLYTSPPQPITDDWPRRSLPEVPPYVLATDEEPNLSITRQMDVRVLTTGIWKPKAS